MMRRVVAFAALGVVLLGSCGSDGEQADESSTTSSTECSDELDTTKVPVVVVQDDIAVGTTAEEAIQAGWLVEKEIDWGYRPTDAIESLDDMAGGVAASDLAPGQLAIVAQWGLPTDMTVEASPQQICPR
jgi:hypothetical protein